MCTACLVALCRKGELAGLIWLHHFEDKVDLLTRFGPAPVSNRYATIHVVFARVQNDVRTRYVGWWKKEGTSCGSSSNAILRRVDFLTGDPDSS